MQVCSLKKQRPSTGEKRGKPPCEDGLRGVNGPPQSRSPYTPTPLAPDGGAGAARSRAAAPESLLPGPREPSLSARSPASLPHESVGPEQGRGARLPGPSAPSSGFSMPGARLRGPLTAQAPPPAAPRCRPRPRRPPHLACAETRTRGADRDRSSSSAPAGPRRKPLLAPPRPPLSPPIGPHQAQDDIGLRAIGKGGRPSPCPGPPRRRGSLPAEAWAGARGPERPLLLLCHRGAAAAPSGSAGNGGDLGIGPPDGAGRRGTCGARGVVSEGHRQCRMLGPETKGKESRGRRVS